MKVSDQHILQQLQRASLGGDLKSISEAGLKGVARDCDVFIEDVERVFKAAVEAQAQVAHGGRAEYGGIPFGPWNVERAPKGDAANVTTQQGTIAEGTNVAQIPAELRERVAKFAHEIAEDPLTRMALEVMLLREMTEKQGAERLAAPPAKGNWKPARALTNSMELDWNRAQQALASAGLWKPQQHISSRELEAKTGQSPADYLDHYVTRDMSSEQLIRGRVTDWGAQVMKKLEADRTARTPEALASLAEAIARRGRGQDVDLALKALAYFPIEQSFPVLLEQLASPRRDAAMILLGQYARQAKHPLPADHPLLNPVVRSHVKETLGRALFDIAAAPVVLASIDLMHAGTSYRGAAMELLQKAIAENPPRPWNDAVIGVLVDRAVEGAVAKDEAMFKQIDARLPVGSAAKVRLAEGLAKIEADFQGALSEMRTSWHRSNIDARSEVILDVVERRMSGFNPEQAVRFAEAVAENVHERKDTVSKWRVWPGDVAYIFGTMANQTPAMTFDDAQRARIDGAVDRLARAFDQKTQLPSGQLMETDTRPLFGLFFDQLKQAPWGKNEGPAMLRDLLAASQIDKVAAMNDVETLVYVDAIRRQADAAQLGPAERNTLGERLREIYDFWGWPEGFLPALHAQAERLAEDYVRLPAQA